MISTLKVFDIETASDILKTDLIITNSGLIPSLPDDQWTGEVIGWESVVWAAAQMMIADFSIGVAARIPSAAGFQTMSLGISVYLEY